MWMYAVEKEEKGEISKEPHIVGDKKSIAEEFTMTLNLSMFVSFF